MKWNFAKPSSYKRILVYNVGDSLNYWSFIVLCIWVLDSPSIHRYLAWFFFFFFFKWHLVIHNVSHIKNEPGTCTCDPSESKANMSLSSSKISNTTFSCPLLIYNCDLIYIVTFNWMQESFYLKADFHKVKEKLQVFHLNHQFWMWNLKWFFLFPKLTDSRFSSGDQLVVCG